MYVESAKVTMRKKKELTLDCKGGERAREKGGGPAVENDRLRARIRAGAERELAGDEWWVGQAGG